MLLSIVFFLYCYGSHRDLHSFPTRRSSALRPLVARGAAWAREHPCERPRSAGLESLRHAAAGRAHDEDRKSTRLNSSHVRISYAVFCLKKKNLHATSNLNPPLLALSQRSSS